MAYRRICKGFNEARASWQELKNKDAAALNTLLGKSNLAVAAVNTLLGKGNLTTLPDFPDLAADAACGN